MQTINHNSQQKNVNSNKQTTYEVPAVIYEGLLTTRAGSGPLGSPDTNIDPADLFGEG